MEASLGSRGADLASLSELLTDSFVDVMHMRAHENPVPYR